MADFEVLGSDTRYRGFMTQVRADRLRGPHGEFTREIYAHADAVAIVPVDAHGRVVLVRQYRHAFGTRLLEIPAGMLDIPGEEPLAAAQRELAEEVGMAAGVWTELVTFHNSAGWTDESTTVYLATELSDVGPPEGFEAVAEEADMEVVRIELAAAAEMVRAGEVPDAKTAIGVLLAAAARSDDRRADH